VDSIHSWSDRRDVFIGNFQGTYKHPGNSRDLRKQRSGETLCDYIRCFSKKCNELPDAVDTDVVTVFLSGTSNWVLVHELGRTKPRTMKKLLDITTNFTSGAEAINAVIHPNPGSEAKVDDQGSTLGKKKNGRSGNKCQNWGPNDDEDDVRVVAGAVDRSVGKRPATDHNNRFEQQLEKPCPHHEGEVKQKLNDCKLMKRFLTKEVSSSGKKEGTKPPPNQDKGDELPKPDACLMIFGGTTTQEGKC
jgi:hypothetical protein